HDGLPICPPFPVSAPPLFPPPRLPPVPLSSSPVSWSMTSPGSGRTPSFPPLLPPPGFGFGSVLPLSPCAGGFGVLEEGLRFELGALLVVSSEGSVLVSSGFGGGSS